MDFGELVHKNRSYRRFKEAQRIEPLLLEELIGLARFTASANNRQPLKYILAADERTNRSIFPHLSWAALLKDWNGPEEGKRPAAYIIILGDNTISEKIDCDHGIAAQTILLGAVERGLGGCIIGSIDRLALRRELGIQDRYNIMLVVALGRPAEKVVLENVKENGDTSYWRDKEGVHHVPKRTLPELIIRR